MTYYAHTTKLDLPFNVALAKTREALRDEGCAIITEINLQRQLEQHLDQSTRRYWILGVWVPAWELKAVAAEPEIGLLMPSHLCLWANADGSATLATADLKGLAATTDHPALAEAARAVHARLSAVTDWVRTTTMNTAAGGGKP